MSWHNEKMSNLSFRMMTLIFQFVDAFYSYIPKRIESFGISKGMTIIDYGCGPGRYTFRFAEIVDNEGKIYAVDIHELAIQAIQKRIKRDHIKNVEAKLADGYNVDIGSGSADIICALDMFFIVSDTNSFLKELRRLCKINGTLILDDGHQPRKKTIEALEKSGAWTILEENPDHLKCKPV
jgi:ubiquinone/menaquinone biosynthesis C-methylase UbiE